MAVLRRLLYSVKISESPISPSSGNKKGAYKIHAFVNDAILCRDNASYFILSDVYFLQGRSKGKGTLIKKNHTFSTI